MLKDITFLRVANINYYNTTIMSPKQILLYHVLFIWFCILMSPASWKSYGS